MKFEPVYLTPDRALNRSISMTFARHYNRCARSAFLYQQHEGGPPSVEMLRGRAMHRMIEVAIRTAIEEGEPIIPPDVVKAIVDEVIADPGYWFPVEQHDYVREAMHRWASETAIEAAAVVALETLFELDLGAFVLRGRIDFAELLEDGAALRVRDWKSGRGLPTQEEVGRVRPDGTLMAKNLQLIAYALLAAFGRPIRVEGEGRVETPEPFAVAERAQRFDLEFVFPGVESRDGTMATRGATLSRTELHPYLESFRSLAAQVAHSVESGNWPAVRSDEACGECPAMALCPIPEALRSFAGEINTLEQASETATRMEWERDRQAAIKREVKAWAKRHGVAVPVGAGEALDFVYRERTEITDRDGLLEAVDRAVMFGEPFERSDFVRTRTATSFEKVKVDAD